MFAASFVYLFFAVCAWRAGFVSLNGTAAWLDTSAEVGIVALAVGLLMIAGEFDLSIGSVIGATSILFAIGTNHYQMNPWIMLAMCFALGAVTGLVNGAITVKTRLPSFIVTLATNYALIGAALGFSRLLTNTTSSSIQTTPGVELLFGSQWGQANVAVLWWLALTVVATIVLWRTPFGNWVYATGGNESAARGAGVPTGFVKIVLFIVTSLTATLLGVIQAVEFHSGNAANGQGYVFEAPIVAVIGGVLLGGGYGSPLGVFFGSIIFGVITVGIFYAGWNTDWLMLFLGALLLAAVLANSYFRRLALSEG
ncbi:monosaccharide ABC transporter membrane protein (CUT2 family) [Roseiarcus fermentans]|uniref:Xylose transport system permease protein XylH n=1 Tax=Roseiarcus fermentans TaxID=1473586 RepID=A0A366F9X9_9HYPH|nr:monosaccharide ABC transporter membrane protein (CUT2 family) [Roseiarcus fermentans]